VSIHVLTGLAKKYAKRPIDPNSTFAKRLATDPKDPKTISVPKLT